MKTKKIFNKFVRVLLTLVTAFTVFMIPEKASAITFSQLGPDSVIPVDYATLFTSSGTVTLEGSLPANWTAHGKGYSDSTYYIQRDDGQVTQSLDLWFSYSGNVNEGETLLTSSQSISVRYWNVCSWGDQTVDCIMTLSDVKNTKVETSYYKNGASDPEVFNMDGKIMIDSRNIGFLAGKSHVSLTFVYSGTNHKGTAQVTDLKGSLVAIDIDDGQSITNMTGISEVHYYPTGNNGILMRYGDGITNVGGIGQWSDTTDKGAMVLMEVTGSVVTFDWCKANISGEYGGYVAFWKESLYKFATPSPKKSVDRTAAYVDSYDGTEQLVYTISQQMPYQDSNFYYTQFTLSDTFRSCETIKSVKVVNETNTDVTSSWTVTADNSAKKVTASPKSLTDKNVYSHTYKLIVTVTVDETQLGESEFSPGTDEGTYLVNSATLTFKQTGDSSSSTRTSNQVRTDFFYTILSEHDSGSTITDTKENIKGLSNVSFSYSALSGYYITSLKVDGADVSFSKTGGTYTFSSVTAYHEIRVTSSQYYTITTQATHGTVTGKQVNIPAGGNRIIKYSAWKYHYLKSVTVDGKSADISKYPSYYSFFNISADHDIKVVYTPYHEVITKVTNGTISDSVLEQKDGANVNVSYSPDEGYYMASITVKQKDWVATTADDGHFEYSTTTTYASYEQVKNAGILDGMDFNNLMHSYDVEVVYKKNPVIQITKTITPDEVNLANGTPTFIFKITGTDYTGVQRTYYRSIDFKDAVSGDTLSKWSKTITVDIPAGKYTVEEIDSSRFTLEQTKNRLNVTVTGLKFTADTTKYETCHGEFVNAQTNWKDYSHNDIVVNSIKSK